MKAFLQLVGWLAGWLARLVGRPAIPPQGRLVGNTASGQAGRQYSLGAGSMQAPGGTFLGWDPLRVMKTKLCGHCGKAGATKRCGCCSLAHYCGRECQRAHWPVHKCLCRAGGYSNYLKNLEGQTRKQSELLKRSGVAEDVIAVQTEMLRMARDMGDAEGQRHLNVALAFRHEVAAEAAMRENDQHQAAVHREAAKQHTARGQSIASDIGQPDSKILGAVNRRQGLPPLPSTSASSCATSAAGDAMFGKPTPGDPLGLLSGLTPIAPPSTALRAPSLLPGDPLNDS